MEQLSPKGMTSIKLNTALRKTYGLGCVLASMLVLTPLVVSVGQESSGGQSSQDGAIPRSWVDADNGYSVIRLSDEPDSKALDSRRNAFTPDGKDMVYLSQSGIHLVSLATRKTKLIVQDRIGSLAVGTKTRRVFFTRPNDRSLYVASLETGAISKVGDLPARAEVTSVNCDETFLSGKNVEVGSPVYDDFHMRAKVEAIQKQRAQPGLKLTEDDIKERAMQMRSDAKIPEELFTVDLRTGQVKSILKTTYWMGYVQFSPTDPLLMMYAHEGMYYESDRIWTIRLDGSQNQLIHARTQKEESATREFWSRDGKTIWYEWQKPRGKD